MTPGSTCTAVLDDPTTANQPALTQGEGVRGIVLKAGGWTIAGDGHTLTVGARGISSTGSCASTIGPTVTLTDSATISVGAGNGLSAMLDDVGGHTIAKAGEGILVLGGVLIHSLEHFTLECIRTTGTSCGRRNRILPPERL